jgi:hypothetical protein
MIKPRHITPIKAPPRAFLKEMSPSMHPTISTPKTKSMSLSGIFIVNPSIQAIVIKVEKSRTVKTAPVPSRLRKHQLQTIPVISSTRGY